MKKYFYIIFVLTLMSFLNGCSNNDEVASELIDYHNNDWQTVQKIKTEEYMSKVSEYERIENENDNRANALFIEEELLPIQKEVVDYLKSIELEHKEVQELNQLQIDAEEFSYEVTKEEINALNDPSVNESMITLGDAEELENMYDKFLNKREDLMEKYDITWTEEINQNGEEVMKMEKTEK